MKKRAVAFLALCFAGLALPSLARVNQDWLVGRDGPLGVVFRYPRDWRQSRADPGTVSIQGSDGSLKLIAVRGATPDQVCREDAGQHLQPFGANPTIRSLRVQGQKACLVWPSEERGANSEAELVVQFPTPVTIDGTTYTQLTMYADKNHIRDLMRTLKFLKREEPGR
jgi:TolB protein